MATLKQMIANRLNAMRSTGPRSDAGKARSRHNALKHGLSRIGVAPPAMTADLIADRKDQWRGDYRPEGPAQEWLFERLCAESVRLDACERRLIVARAEHAERAAESWDDDRAAAVAELAAGLGKRPEVIQPKLLRSRHGVLWLLERWDELLAASNRLGAWTPEAWERAMDLLGVSAAARAGSGPWELEAAESSPVPGPDLIDRSVTALKEKLDGHLDARDARSRADAEAGLGDEDAPEVRRLERYARDARRRIAWCRDELLRLQAAAAAAPAADRPPRAPAPRPPRNPAPSPSSPSTAASAPPPPGPSAPVAAASASTSACSATPGRSLAAGFRDRLHPPAAAPNRRARRALAAASRRS